MTPAPEPEDSDGAFASLRFALQKKRGTKPLVESGVHAAVSWSHHLQAALQPDGSVVGK